MPIAVLYVGVEVLFLCLYVWLVHPEVLPAFHRGLRRSGGRRLAALALVVLLVAASVVAAVVP